MPAVHDAKSGVPGSPDDNFRAPFGTATCVRFDEAGTYPFFCEPHQFTGQIVVE
jgi:plastocyanin